MADFRTEEITSQGAGTQAVAPVQQQVAPEFDKNPIFNKMIEGFSDYNRAALKKKAEDDEAQIVSDYLAKEGKIQAARRTGQWDNSRASMASKANFYEFISGNTKHIKALKEARATLYEGTETGDADKELEAEKARKLVEDRMLDEAGLPPFPGQSDKTRRLQIEAVAEAKRTEKTLAAARADAAEQRQVRAEGRAISEFEQKALDRRLKEEAWSMTSHLVSKEFEAFHSGMLDLMNSNMDPDVAKATAAQQLSRIRAMAVQMAGPDNQEFVTAAMSSFTEVYNVTLESKKPGANLQKLTDQVAEIKARGQLQILADPKTAMDVSASELVRQDPITAAKAGQSVSVRVAQLEKLGGGGSATYNTPQVIGSSDEAATLDTIQTALKNAGVKGWTDKGEQGAANTVAGLLRQTEAIVSQGAPPETLKRVAKFYSSVEFGKLAASGKVDVKALEGAAKAFEGYHSATLEAVEASMAEAAGPAMRGTQAPKIQDSVNINFQNGRIVFVPVDGLKWSAEAAKTMQKSEEALTNLFKIGAHMERTQDYAKFFEERKHIILPKLYADPVKFPVGYVNQATGYKFKGGIWSNAKNWEKVKENE
jgi:hypothetical protein